MTVETTDAGKSNLTGRASALGEGLVTVADVAAFLNVTPMTVYRMTYAGKLRGKKLGRSVRFKAAEIRRYEENLPVVSAPR